MKLIDKSALVAEIERRLEAIASTSTDNNREMSAIKGAQQYELINLIQFLDSLEVKEMEEEPVSNDLEEAVKKYLTSLRKSHFEGYDIERAFKKGAKWQKEQMEKEVDLEKELSYEDYIRFFDEHPNFPDDWGFDECWVFAEYFYKLGLKAQKGE